MLPLPSSSLSTALLGPKSSGNEREHPTTDGGILQYIPECHNPRQEIGSRTSVVSFDICGVCTIGALLDPLPDVTAAIKDQVSDVGEPDADVTGGTVCVFVVFVSLQLVGWLCGEVGWSLDLPPDSIFDSTYSGQTY